MRALLFLLVLGLSAACTSTPSDLPACVDPSSPCAAAADAGPDGDAPADAPDAAASEGGD
jgi:hypothetical protein